MSARLSSTAQDVGIAFGQAVKQALGTMAGITRYASVHMPMDETLSRVVIDISGRPSCLAANPDRDPATLCYQYGPAVLIIDYGPRNPIEGTGRLHEVAATGLPN